MLNKINERMEYYVIERTPRAMGEDNEYAVNRDGVAVGYAIVNKEYNQVEYTTMILPTAIFQAEYLDKALKSLLNDEPVPEIQDVAADDVLIN